MGLGAPIVTIMATPTMSDIADLLTLNQWLSPAFPIGGFAYSHGLESLIASGQVASAADLKSWLWTLIEHGSARSDAVFFARGYTADTATLLNIGAEARAFATTAERLRETDLQGRAFVDTCNAIWGFDLPQVPLPVAVGHAAAQKGIALETALPLYLQSMISNLVSVAVRLVPLGQTEGQQTLNDLQAAILAVPISDGPVYSNAFLWDQAAMHHEILQPRLFQS